MAGHLDLALLQSGKTQAVVFARQGSDFAVEKINCGKAISGLISFRDRIEKVVTGEPANRPSADELADFGLRLYAALIFRSVEDLYKSAVSSKSDIIRLHIVSNHPTLQAIPWEYINDPKRVPGPKKDLSVVRVLLGQSRRPPLDPLPLDKRLRVVLAYAEPPGEETVPWPEMENLLKTDFKSSMPGNVTLEFVRGADVKSLNDAISNPKSPCHILHFVGHGNTNSRGEGVLLMEDGAELNASKLAGLLGSSGIRMVVLSACKTASGNFKTNFAVTSQTLLSEGIPIVLANQLSIPTKSVAPFMGRFYQSLVETGGDVDRSVAEARVLLDAFITTKDVASLEWGIPTLYRNIDLSKFFGP